MSARDAVQSSLSRIKEHDSSLGAFLFVCEDHALEQATQVDAQIRNGQTDLPLAGVPIAIKDNICTDFAPTTCASKILNNFCPPYSAHVIEKLTHAGAIIVGKTNLDEFAMGSSTENSAKGITRNPWDRERVPGGSSGGSAVSVASGMTPLALGSDTGGSIRQPASLTGVVGIKPTYGCVSRYGLVAYGSSLDQIGPMARTVEDAALLLGTIVGHDARDSTSVAKNAPDYVANLSNPIAGKKIGIAREYFGEGLDAQTRSAVEFAIEVLRGLGAETVEIELPHTKYAIACYYLIATAEASSNLARYDGVHYGHRSENPRDIFELYSASREEGFGREVKRRLMLGTHALSSGYYDAYYLRAMKVRTLLRKDFEKAFANVDVICSPTTPTTAFRIGEKTDDPLAMYLADIYTISANLAGIPAMSVPCGFDSTDLPIGMQLMGPAFSESNLINIAHQYEISSNHFERVPG
ncbi:MAG: Asp-tRNA(Asn)/Glu-tRNA(Gln) amidotransferase subunit GatA [Planctomycetes bacterium]|nr:Asp-tRNA(Asn)/Glu-tRNA(Gln) amidotransferase subunit GatA [Planctomycetota bacterium]